MKIKLAWFWYFASAIIAGILCVVPAIMCIKTNTLWLSSYVAVIPIVIALCISWYKLFDKYDIW